MSTCELEKNNNKTSLSQHTPQPTAKYLFSQAFSNSGSPSLKRSSFSLFFSFFSSSFLFATPLDPSRPKHKDCPVGCRCGRGWGWGGSRGSSGCRKQAKFQRKKKKKKVSQFEKAPYTIHQSSTRGSSESWTRESAARRWRKHFFCKGLKRMNQECCVSS